MCTNEEIYYAINEVYQVILFLNAIPTHHYLQQNQCISKTFINAQYLTINWTFSSQIKLKIIKIFQEIGNVPIQIKLQGNQIVLQ